MYTTVKFSTLVMLHLQLYLPAGSDYETTTFMLTFEPSDDVEMLCGKVTIIDNTTPELTEQFSVKLVSVSPVGVIGDDTTCVAILDNDRELWIF